MKHYLKNLLTALCGNNPYQMELDKVREEYSKTAGRVKELDELYGKVSQQLEGCQRLIENLRGRIAEKDELLRRTKKEYQQRIEKYNKVIGELSEKQPKAAKPARRKTRKPKQNKDE